jgi:hypothetical protein
MKHKFILQTLNEQTGEVVNNYPCKTFKEIALILDMDYHQARLLYLHNKRPSKLHPFLLERSKRFKILDNPEVWGNNPTLH